MLGIKTRLKWFVYDNVYTPWNLFRLRHKKTIRVLFVLTDLSLWKTELLYQKMSEHPRFTPILGITPTQVDPEESREKLREYCDERKYEYQDIDTKASLTAQTGADIIIYPQPYSSNYYSKHIFTKNKSALIIHFPYGVHSIMEEWILNMPFYLHIWQHYFENESIANEFGSKMKNHGKNIFVTGTPFMDLMMKKPEGDPWKDKSGKKRIIYAPHHTIGSQKIHDAKGVNYSTFLQNSEFMLEMANKYKDSVYFAFKPHPYLKRKLYTVWGEERTDDYYKKWHELENAQLEMGDYIGLFHYSDAMIHDCGAFTTEFLYMHKPVMYLVKDKKHNDNLTELGKEAYNLHYHAWNPSDIEKFIIDVIHGKDEKKEKREAFYSQYLIPPGGRSACDNVIEAILSGKRYAR